MYKNIWLGLLLMTAACGNSRSPSTADTLQQQQDDLQTISDGRVFEPSFYLRRYDDLARAFGSNADLARWHWDTYGRSEGRTATPGFDVRYYMGQYPDLQRAYGEDFVRGVWHYLNYGLSEGRRGSIVFDPVFYLERHPDLRAAYGDQGYEAAYRHWRIWGGPLEGRMGSADFDPRYYLDRYDDVRAAYGSNNYWAAIKHFLIYGQDEGRQGVPSAEPPPEDAGTEVDAGYEPDGGVAPDAGTVVPDAGSEDDGGSVIPDAGSEDDGGTPFPDAGVEPDAGTGLPDAVVDVLSPTPFPETGSCRAVTPPAWPFEALSCEYASNGTISTLLTATPSATQVTEWIVDATQEIPQLHALRATAPTEYQRALIAMAQWIQEGPYGRVFPLFGSKGGLALDRGLERGCDECLCAINRLTRTAYCKYTAHLGEKTYAQCMDEIGLIFDFWANRCQAMHQQAWNSNSHRGFRAAAYAHNLAVNATCPPGACTPSQIADLVVNLYKTNPTFPLP